ncbi:hypothetical protein [Kitasatospora sp. NPDC017646]|uniref:hypothetical protein n=1 Tax=Kitasatospora sp. NPDC017646 TaxID=3364024 RepID=UPI0037B07F64
MAEHQAAERADGDRGGLHVALTETVRTVVGAALADGTPPASSAAAPVLATLTAAYAEAFQRPDDTALRHWLLARLGTADDPRAERYWQLLAVINGWPVQEGLREVFDWFTEALRARLAGC